MVLKHNYRRFIGNPVGVSFINGQGTSGVLCKVSEGKIYLMEYLYQDQFALKHYELNSIGNIYSFPRCPSKITESGKGSSENSGSCKKSEKKNRRFRLRK